MIIDSDRKHSWAAAGTVVQLMPLRTDAVTYVLGSIAGGAGDTGESSKRSLDRAMW